MASATATGPPEKRPEIASDEHNDQQPGKPVDEAFNHAEGERLQHGVQIAQAATQLWTVKQLAVLYVMYAPSLFALLYLFRLIKANLSK